MHYTVTLGDVPSRRQPGKAAVPHDHPLHGDIRGHRRALRHHDQHGRVLAHHTLGKPSRKLEVLEPSVEQRRRRVATRALLPSYSVRSDIFVFCHPPTACSGCLSPTRAQRYHRDERCLFVSPHPPSPLSVREPPIHAHTDHVGGQK